MKVAFASCCHAPNSISSSQPIWGIIQKQEPDLLVLLGDNVYIGKEGYDAKDLKWKMKILEAEYKSQLAEPHFSKLLDEVPFLVVWDNHDLGLPGEKYRDEHPNADVYGAEVSTEFRDASRELFNEYFRLKPKSIIRPSNKIYGSHVFGEGDKKIKFIMLDVRSWQEDPASGDDAKLIGEKQKEWLKDEMLSGEAGINVVCSGMTFTVDNNPDKKGGWEQHVNWFREFKDIAKETSRPLFLGGNIHRNNFHPYQLDGIGRNAKYLYEIISSGIGHRFKPNGDDPSPDDDEDVDEATGIDEIRLRRIRSSGAGFNTFSKLPCHNYGIIDFTDTLVKVTLYSQKPGNNYYAEISRDSWRLKKNWRMGDYSYNYD